MKSQMVKVSYCFVFNSRRAPVKEAKPNPFMLVWLNNNVSTSPDLYLG